MWSFVPTLYVAVLFWAARATVPGTCGGSCDGPDTAGCQGFPSCVCRFPSGYNDGKNGSCVQTKCFDGVSKLTLKECGKSCGNGCRCLHYTQKANTRLFATISSSKACEKNVEGVRIAKELGTGYTLDTCKAACKEPCQAIDFFTSTGRCNLYDLVCKTPLSAVDGASSYTRNGFECTEESQPDPPPSPTPPTPPPPPPHQCCCLHSVGPLPTHKKTEGQCQTDFCLGVSKWAPRTCPCTCKGTGDAKEIACCDKDTTNGTSLAAELFM